MTPRASHEMTDELWLPVVGFEGRYEVSNYGRLRSLCYGAGPNGRRKRATPKVVKLGTQRIVAYPIYPIDRRPRRIHRLVAEAFLGPCPIGREVAHVDGNPRNSSVSNLRYVTRAENHAHKILHGTDNRGSKNHKAKLTEQDIISIRAEASVKGINRRLMRKFNVSEATISLIRRRKSWTHL